MQVLVPWRLRGHGDASSASCRCRAATRFMTRLRLCGVLRLARSRPLKQRLCTVCAVRRAGGALRRPLGSAIGRCGVKRHNFINVCVGVRAPARSDEPGSSLFGVRSGGAIPSARTHLWAAILPMSRRRLQSATTTWEFASPPWRVAVGHAHGLGAVSTGAENTRCVALWSDRVRARCWLLPAWWCTRLRRRGRPASADEGSILSKNTVIYCTLSLYFK